MTSTGLQRSIPLQRIGFEEDHTNGNMKNVLSLVPEKCRKTMPKLKNGAINAILSCREESKYLDRMIRPKSLFLRSTVILKTF